MDFAEERFADVLPEIYPLWEMHWMETEMYRHGEVLNPDLKRYQYYNDINFYHVFTARDGGKLVGNAGMYVSPCMHTQKIVATEDTWFLLPEYRKGRNAIKFHDYIQAEVKKLGAIRITMDAKLTNKAGRVMEYLGYQIVGNRYTKEI